MIKEKQAFYLIQLLNNIPPNGFTSLKEYRDTKQITKDIKEKSKLVEIVLELEKQLESGFKKEVFEEIEKEVKEKGEEMVDIDFNKSLVKGLLDKHYKIITNQAILDELLILCDTTE